MDMRPRVVTAIVLPRIAGRFQDWKQSNQTHSLVTKNRAETCAIYWYLITKSVLGKFVAAGFSRQAELRFLLVSVVWRKYAHFFLHNLLQ